MLCVSTVACTTSLEVKAVNLTTPGSRVGIPWPLPYTTYDIEITRQVAECGETLTAMVKAEVKATVATADPNQLFVLNNNSLSNPFRTSEVKVEYAAGSGAPISFNAVAEDRTGPVVANVLATAVKLVSVAAASGGTGETKIEACSAAVLDARKKILELTPTVKAAATLVETNTAGLKAVTDKIASLGANVDDATKARLSKAYDDLALAVQDLATKKAALDKELKVVTYVTTVRWPGDGDKGTGLDEIPEAVFRKWGNVDDQEAREKFAVHFSLTGLNAAARDLGKRDVVAPRLGVPYRVPQRGELKICSGGVCSDANQPITQQTGDVLQLGYIYYLPCESRPFSSVSCAFTMTESGQLKSMGTAQKTATAEGLTGTMKDVVSQLDGARQAAAGAETAKLKAQTDALKARAEYEAAVLALRPNPAQPEKDETAMLRASSELLAARKAEIDARLALEEAMARLNGAAS